MAIDEELCWKVLDMTKDQALSREWLKGSPTDEPDLLHALPLVKIEYELVLKHTKSQIEDSLYFLQKRGYLNQHGHTGLTRVALQLTQRSLDVLQIREFTEEEQEAFREALLDLNKPGWLGMKFNLAEAYRRTKKRSNRG